MQATPTPTQETQMDREHAALKAQRSALKSYLAAQERRKYQEEPIGPDRKKSEDAVRQQADESRGKADQELRDLRKVAAESRAVASQLLKAVNKSWNESSFALRQHHLVHLLSDPSSFDIDSNSRGDPVQAMMRCDKTAGEARRAIEDALLDMQKLKEQRIWLVSAFVAVVGLIVVLAGISHNQNRTTPGVGSTQPAASPITIPVPAPTTGQAPSQGLPIRTGGKKKGKKNIFLQAQNWKNEDPHTRGITRIQFVLSDTGKMMVHAWGSCHPRDCDWGLAEATHDGDSWLAAWNLRGGVHNWQVSIDTPSRIKVSEHTDAGMNTISFFIPS